MPFGSWIPRDKAQEKIGYLQSEHLPKKRQLGTIFGKSTTTTAYKTV